MLKTMLPKPIQAQIFAEQFNTKTTLSKVHIAPISSHIKIPYSLPYSTSFQP